MKYAIRVEETKGKTFIVEADSLDEAIDKVDSDDFIDLYDEEVERNTFPSPYAMPGGIATEEQLANCTYF